MLHPGHKPYKNPLHRTLPPSCNSRAASQVLEYGSAYDNKSAQLKRILMHFLMPVLLIPQQQARNAQQTDEQSKPPRPQNRKLISHWMAVEANTPSSVAGLAGTGLDISPASSNTSMARTSATDTTLMLLAWCWAFKPSSTSNKRHNTPISIHLPLLEW